MQGKQRRIAAIIAAAAVAGMAVGCANSSEDSSATVGGEVTTTNAGATETSETTATEGTDAPGTTASPGAPAPGAPGAPEDGTAAPAEGADSTRIATPAGEFVVQGVILQKYNEVGGATSPLGLPTANEEPAPNGGTFSTFEGGAIYWTPETGAHIVWGGIRDAWEAEGGAGGSLGYPTTDEQTIPGGWQSEFQHGTITYTDGQPHIEMK